MPALLAILKEFALACIGLLPKMVELWQERQDRKAERRLARRKAIKERAKEKCDAVDNDDPAALIRAANRVRDEEDSDPVTGD